MPMALARACPRTHRRASRAVRSRCVLLGREPDRASRQARDVREQESWHSLIDSGWVMGIVSRPIPQEPSTTA